MLRSGNKLIIVCISFCLVCSVFKIRAQPECNITGGSDRICSGTSTTWRAPEGMLSYSWAGPSGFISDSREIEINISGIYTVTITDPAGTSTCSRELIVNPELNPGSINTTLREFCIGGTTLIGGTSPPFGPATGGSGIYIYTWQMQTGCIGSWSDIPGTNLTSYSPGPPMITTCYRRKVEDPLCNSTAWTDYKRFEIYEDPVSQLIVPLPPDQAICAGSPASAIFTGGSGGFPGGTTDLYEFSINAGAVWNAYNPGGELPTAGLEGSNILRVRTRRISIGVNGCNWGSYVIYSWSVNPQPVTSPIYHN